MVAVSRQRNQRRKFLYKIRNNSNKKRIFVFFRGQGIFTFMFYLTRKVLDIVKELRLFIFIGAKRFAGSSTSGMDFSGRPWLVKQREPDSARIYS